MTTYDSIVVVEDWISEHYFTSDGKGTNFQKSVRALRTAWNAAHKEGFETVRSRFTSQRNDLLQEFVRLSEESGSPEPLHEKTSEVGAILRSILGLPGTPERLAFERGNSDISLHGLWLDSDHSVLWLDATLGSSLEDTLFESSIQGDLQIDGKDQDTLTAGKLISELYLCDPSPKYIVVSAGPFIYLTDRERWPEGRYLAVNAQLIAERNETKVGGEVDRFLAIFGRDSLIPSAEGTLWWDERLNESREHAVGVSQDLRDGIRESIEIIANDVLQRRRSQNIETLGSEGQELAKQSLRFLYRILFLLYAEASPELGVLPRGAGEYDAGYGLERLRELIQVDLTSASSQQGTHLYESLHLLFTLINGDHPTQRNNGKETSEDSSELQADEGLVFESLEADLFSPQATSLIDQTKLSNFALQQVLERLLLSRANSKTERGFISYANLGINQLGAVYEGLMSYTGFIAEEDLREVAKDGDASKGSWVVPVTKIDAIDSKHFVRRRNPETNELQPVHYPKGSFVFRLAGRERQTSASYYSPEVITKFVVSQALAELLTDETPADEILTLDVCETFMPRWIQTRANYDLAA